MSTGKIVQVMGPVVDVEFESGDLPEFSQHWKSSKQKMNGLSARYSSILEKVLYVLFQWDQPTVFPVEWT